MILDIKLGNNRVRARIRSVIMTNYETGGTYNTYVATISINGNVTHRQGGNITLLQRQILTFVLNRL